MANLDEECTNLKISASGKKHNTRYDAQVVGIVCEKPGQTHSSRYAQECDKRLAQSDANTVEHFRKVEENIKVIES